MGTPTNAGAENDPRTDYNYTADDGEPPASLSGLADQIDGAVRFDSYTRQLYATDASAYKVEPVGVAFPTDTDDVSTVVKHCADASIAVLPRGGGTSLAGQTVNEAIVLDFTRHMDGVDSVDPAGETATVQSGCYLGDLNAALAEYDLKFAPDPAWGDKSAIGGAIGNNSTGSHSLRYGKTDAYIESVEAVLADGTVARLGDIEIETMRERADPDADWIVPRVYAQVCRIIDEDADLIREQYPDLKRNVSGYNLDVLISEAENGSVNLARLLAGSEGTLAVITEATVSLEPVPETKAIALLLYEELMDAMADVAPILDHNPAAVEVMDDVLLDLARDTSEFAEMVGTLPKETDSVLLVEFYADSDDQGRTKVADLVADRVPESDTEADPSDGRVRTDAKRTARGVLEAHDPDTRARFWKLRKSGLPILLSRTSDAKHLSFIEDCAIPPARLPEYVAGFQEILAEHDTTASFYAHAGPGVLHVRPLINSKTVAGVEQIVSIAEAVTDLVVAYGGSVSGEHGDGRARTQWNQKLYGEHLWEVFRDLKTAFDPDWLLNPGQVCGEMDLTENLRFDPDYEFEVGFDPELDWANENGFQGMAELCHGCGGCRGHQSTTGGVMCPTYRAAEEESLSTRGRANLLRQAMSGDLPGGSEEAFDVEFMTEVMDLCIGCKGCAQDCPSEVDMAKMKAEISHEHHQRHGASLRDRLFANIDRVSALGSRLAPLSNWATALPGARDLLERTVGIAADRTLPTFHRETFADWFEARGPRVSAVDADRGALLVPDTYTNHNNPAAGMAAVRVLEAADIRIRLPPGVTDSGRAAFSKGFIGKARSTARRNVETLDPLIRRGWDVVVVEPSDAVMFQSDYPDLLLPDDPHRPSETVAAGEGGERPAADAGTRTVGTVATNTYGVLEYVDRFGLDDAMAFEDHDAEALTYHGHCHQKATGKDHHAVGVLRRAGYLVDPLDSGCCGMAGSFGYEAEHRSMSRAIAEVLYEQVDASGGKTVVAPGASCRTQLGERTASEPPHPVEKVAEAVSEWP